LNQRAAGLGDGLRFAKAKMLPALRVSVFVVRETVSGPVPSPDEEAEADGAGNPAIIRNPLSTSRLRLSLNVRNNRTIPAMASLHRVTLKQIAEHTGLTRMAVSLALRDKPGVSATTRAKVQEIAASLGYVPDPEVSNLMARIRASRPVETKACIGLLTAGPAPVTATSITERKYIDGVIDRARVYGYRVEEFHIGDGGMSASRVSSILWSRGIDGVILRPLQYGISGQSSRAVRFDFERFSSVAISETIITPDFDRSLHDQYTAMLTTMEELTKLGYRRIGLVIEDALNFRVNGRWTAAFMQFQLTSGQPGQPPPLILHDFAQKDFERWFKRHQPDAIVSVNRFGLGFIEHLGLNMPRDIGYASLDLDGEPEGATRITGIDQNSHLVGAAAVDMLVVSMQRKQRGIPLHPMRIEVEGEWKPGNTTRKARKNMTRI
jgi:DNA-binding LacI/PurR family transcriptional regulator